ncbi:hydroxymethylglutaryl-CoA lyase [Bosea sp. TND4EK4]|uniref:hydroxymethylglutaryl-CoA lyase n=1 Tax=Bosea sp. TND4EK4 TaxID=1907408 RepID=UPI0009549AF6|nr:hydroxymethylglutaryl-CoA lyase [Bosea sp. TND4EK4]SIR45350.1 hydroxymethylglutaryl-CoA lyase [Bosea sp. TND4EK4]
MPETAILTDVVVRDGLQALKTVVPTQRKIELVRALIAAGCTRLEVASFVNPKLVPTMADADELCGQLPRAAGVQYGGVVLDSRGMDRLLEADLDWGGVVIAASDTFLERNQRCDRAGALARIVEIERMRRDGKTRISGYVSCCFACPYEGPTDFEVVAELCDTLLQLGVDDVYLADTNGHGTPPKTRELLNRVLARVPADRLGCHFHDTHGQAIANLDVALLAGIRAVDAATAGLGGCMFAPGATGNVASEDVLVLLAAHGIDTGIDAQRMAIAGQSLCDELGLLNNSKSGQALLAAYQ